MQITDYLRLLNANSKQEFKTGESLEKQVKELRAETKLLKKLIIAILKSLPEEQLNTVSNLFENP